MGLIFWFIIAPVAGLAIMSVNYAVAWGGYKRLVGVITCPVLGGLCVFMGWLLALVGFSDGVYQVTYPISGWSGIVVGALVVLVGTPWSIFGHKRFLPSSIMQGSLPKSQYGAPPSKIEEELKGDSKNIVVNCGACYTKFHVRKEQGVVKIKCPNCGRESRIMT